MRLGLDLIMEQIAEGSGVSYEAIINWEVRGRRPRQQQFARLCRFHEDHGHMLAGQLHQACPPIRPRLARCGPKRRRD